MTSARTALSSGSSEASSAPPKTTSRTTSAASDADADGEPGARPFGVGDGLAAERRCARPAPSADSAALIRFLASAVVTCVRLLVPGHAGERDGAVPADLRRARLGVGAGDALHPGHRGDLGQRRGHRGPHRGGPDGGAVRGLDHDLVALTRRGREVLRQQADRRLRVGARQAEVGVETRCRRPR